MIVDFKVFSVSSKGFGIYKQEFTLVMKSKTVHDGQLFPLSALDLMGCYPALAVKLANKTFTKAMTTLADEGAIVLYVNVKATEFI